jgi:uncharacterized metal-binding protein
VSGWLTFADNVLIRSTNRVVYQNSTGKVVKWPKELRQSSVTSAKTTSVCIVTPMEFLSIARRKDSNLIYGLFVAYDTISITHSKAPVTCVVVKDMVIGNNPGAALLSPYHRVKLAVAYGRGRAAGWG